MFRFSSGLSLYGGNENGQGFLIYESLNQNDSFLHKVNLSSSTKLTRQEKVGP